MLTLNPYSDCLVILMPHHDAAEPITNCQLNLSVPVQNLPCVSEW